MEKKVMYVIEYVELIKFFNEIIQQREQAKNFEVHLTLKEVLSMTKKTRSTLWKWEKDGYLKPVRVGKSLFYLKSDIEDLMTQKRF
jgi:predicted DNA-binding transcriptional regulator AlpA